MSSTLKIAQFSDSHLFADINREHFGANVYQNLITTCESIAKISDLSAAIFTGDLTQDHSAASYQLFSSIMSKYLSHVPIFVVPGNHDDRMFLKQYLTAENIQIASRANFAHWQLLLLDSKSDTPAGIVGDNDLLNIASSDCVQENQFVFMHHHPIDVGYFIDRHGLQNDIEFGKSLATNPKIRGIGCGHVHRDIYLQLEITSEHSLPLFSCPATSIRFAKHPTDLVAESTIPAYRIFELTADGAVFTYIIHCQPRYS
ncbi:metallophosphoesterase [Thalassotalea euphylliae]|uniref:metallophosphoesterase n=1 Tax=Thalassotalea euphylliae TaxID=1655234 RepID=UPI00362A6F59